MTIPTTSSGKVQRGRCRQMFLDGELTEEEARQRTASGTRRFARKQLSWFRRDPRIVWLEAGAPDNVGHIVADVLAAVRAG